ncbi:MAG: acyl-CoA dehydrogenase family protein [Hyphomicrobiales bacterium]
MASPTVAQSPLDSIERIGPIIRQHADASEQQRTLARPIVEALIEHRLFQQMVPAALGGPEIDPITWFRVVEAGARIDGSTGWILFINGSTGLAGQRMTPELAEQYMRDPRTIAAGTTFPLGKATVTDGGFRVSGRWGYASGCKHATILAAFCVAQNENGPISPIPYAPVTTVDQVTIVENWNVMGLAGTGSHDVVWDNVFIPEERCQSLVGPELNPFYRAPVYQLPFMTMFAFPIASVALGIAQHAIDEVTAMAQTKVPNGPVTSTLRERPVAQLQIADANALVGSARAWLYSALQKQWDTVQAGRGVGLPDRIEMWLAAANAVRSGRQAVDLMHLAGGATANFRGNAIERCMRDIHAVSQHAVTSPAMWQAMGAMLAGLPPETPLISL